MELKLSDGKKMFVNDEITYKAYLNRKIEQYIEITKTRTLTADEEKKLNEAMNLYNQIVDQDNKEQEELLAEGKHK